MQKVRLDVYVCQKFELSSREKARAVIMSGIVYVNGQKADKAGSFVAPNDVVEMRGTANKYVSRGGYKLERALESFDLDLNGKVCIDVGASTGGFTDCMLQNGAARVFAVDVGYGQIDWKLRNDPRVTLLERCNVRNISKDNIDCEVDFISVDVSFISLRLVLPALKELLFDDGRIVCLVKPQFEAGREKVGKKGVIKDSSTHYEVLENMYHIPDYQIISIDHSPIKGPEGNIEFLIYLAKDSSTVKVNGLTYPDYCELAQKIVDEVHKHDFRGGV